MAFLNAGTGRGERRCGEHSRVQDEEVSSREFQVFFFLICSPRVRAFASWVMCSRPNITSIRCRVIHKKTSDSLLLLFQLKFKTEQSKRQE